MYYNGINISRGLLKAGLHEWHQNPSKQKPKQEQYKQTTSQLLHSSHLTPHTPHREREAECFHFTSTGALSLENGAAIQVKDQSDSVPNWL